MAYRSLTVFAIKQKSTGYYLPAGKKGKGGSWAEPEKGAAPKLFKQIGRANGFLTIWLKGGVKVSQYQTGDGDYDIGMSYVPQPHRNADDMEVVALALVEVPIPV